MVTMEVFVAAFSALALIVAGAFYWIMAEIRALRKYVQDEFRAERQARQAEREADRQAWQAEREADRQTWQAEREADRQARQADTQRILEAIYFHRHDPDTGDAIFYPPTPLTPAPPAD